MREKILATVVLVLVCGGAILFWYAQSNIPKQSDIPVPTPTASSSILLRSGRVEPPGYKEYYNPHYRISLLYPDTLTVSEFNEGAGATTITFENFGESKGFQIFAAPFNGTSISEEQFKKDIPSGVRKNLKNVTIDGATGATFYSEDNFLGETAEIWFIKEGFLYEVNSFKGLDSWLSDIVTTWKFTP